MGELGAKVRATAELLGTTRLCDTDYGPFKGRVLWRSRGSYVQEQAPQGAMEHGLGWSRRPYGQEQQADHVGDTVTSDY